MSVSTLIFSVRTTVHVAKVLCAIEIYKQTRKEGAIGKSFTSTWSIVLLRLIVFSVYRTVALMLVNSAKR